MRSSPVSVAGSITDWTQVSAGGYNTMALRANGTIWAWGQNKYGQLGDNTTVDKFSPVSVVGGFSDWIQVSAAFRQTLAIRSNGTMWGWGSNPAGMLGDGTLNTSSSPVSVVGGFTDWTQVGGGIFHTSALRANGTIWSWGAGGKGQLGTNSTVGRSSPVSVVGGFTDWAQITAGLYHTSAVRANGTTWAWGSNGLGQLGDSTTVSKSSPVSVSGGFSNWVSVSAGWNHTAGIRAT